MRRREVITLLGGATAGWPLAAQAQQTAAPVVGFLDSRSPDALAERLRGFQQGLKDGGLVEGQSVTIPYRWAENQLERLPSLAAELVHRPVSLIVASGGPAATSAAKAASTSIPIVFGSSDDPVRLGYVASLARPGGNLTGISFLNSELVGKQVELLRELVPAAKRIAVLVNPAGAATSESIMQEAHSAAAALGLQVQALNASTAGEIDAAFASFVRDRPDALFVRNNAFFNVRRLQLTLSAMRHAMPTVYAGREFAEAGGLMTYGSDITHVYRQIGVYTARILKGTKPADLPVMRSTKLELVINNQTARILGFAVPEKLLVAADEVIE
jgi:putative tryptophan/tyrosine transport system substrate-binding protein